MEEKKVYIAPNEPFETIWLKLLKTIMTVMAFTLLRK